MTRHGNANALMLLILLVVIGFVFGFLAWTQYDNCQVVLEGRAESRLNIPPSSSLNRITQEIDQFENDIRELREKIAKHEVQHSGLRSELAQGGFYLRNGQWVGMPVDESQFQSGWTHTANMIRMDHDQIGLWEESYRQAERHDFRALNDARDHARDAIETIGDQIADDEDAFNNTRDRLIQEQDDLNKKQDELAQANRMRNSELAIKKSRLESRIRELLELKLHYVEELDADGQVLAVANGGEHVILDLGVQDKIRAGMRFEIFAMVHGRHVSKGLCEVVEPGPRVSTCRVLLTLDDRRHPIADGDRVGNPVYDKYRTQTFVLAGEFKSFNAEDLANFIERSGGVVRAELDPNVDFLVAGERSDKEKAAAREYRVLAIEEDDLVTFLDTTFRPE